MSLRKFQVTAITPTLAGSGEELTPIDYMVWQNEIRVLDQEKIFKLLARNPRLESYLDQLRKSERLEWAQWGGYAQNYCAEKIPFASAGLVSVWEKAKNEDIYVARFARAAGRGVIPGSALKGAIRTAWWLGAMDPSKALSIWKDAVTSERRFSPPPVRSAGLFSLGDARASADAFRVYQSRVLVVRGEAKSEWKPGQLFVEMAKPGATFRGTAAIPEIALEAARVQTRRWIAEHREYAKAAAMKPLTEAVEKIAAAESALPAASLLIPLGWGAGLSSKAYVPGIGEAEVRMQIGRIPGIRKGPMPNMPFPKTRRVVLDGAGGASLPGWVQIDF